MIDSLAVGGRSSQHDTVLCAAAVEGLRDVLRDARMVSSLGSSGNGEALGPSSLVLDAERVRVRESARGELEDMFGSTSSTSSFSWGGSHDCLPSPAVSVGAPASAGGQAGAGLPRTGSADTGSPAAATASAQGAASGGSSGCFQDGMLAVISAAAAAGESSGPGPSGLNPSLSPAREEEGSCFCERLLEEVELGLILEKNEMMGTPPPILEELSKGMLLVQGGMLQNVLASAP
jgi:hypothetical protein